LVVSALGVTQILAWGSTYYLPAVLAEPVAKDTGWPLSWVVGGLSLGLLVAALVSPRVGGAIERDGGRRILAASALMIGLGQMGLAVAPSLPAFIGCWLVVGAGMGAGLYDAAFATLGRLYGRDARQAITSLTLFGGFASTVCWPLSAYLAAYIGWRGTCAAYAAIQFGLALPVYLLAIPRASPARDDGPAPGIERAAAGPPAAEPRSVMLTLLVTTLTLSAILSATLSVHLLPILQARGASLAVAVSLGALIGPCQVGARAIEMAIARRRHPIWTKLASVSGVAVGIAILWAKAAPVAVALLFYGAGVGLESIARGTLPLALFGPIGYARLVGRLARPSLVAQAAAPWAGALLLARFGVDATLAALAAVALLNVALTAALLATCRKAGGSPA
jgi:MFS family permease